MQNYIGVKLIQAVPMDEFQYATEKNLNHGPAQMDKSGMVGVPGYFVVYPDGYSSWSPKEAFERAYLPIELPNILVQMDIDQMIAQVKATTVDPKTTLVNAELVTGFMLYETSSCVDEKNYNENLGAENAMGGINKRIWFAMGFLLQWAKYGLKHTNKNVEA